MTISASGGPWNFYMRKILLSVLLIFTSLACLAPFRGISRPAVDVTPTVKTHPDGALYVGDLVSFEVINPPGIAAGNSQVTITLGDQILGKQKYDSYGLGGRSQATFYWAWDTHSLAPGSYTLIFTDLPDQKSWRETFTLLPRSQLPAPEPLAGWRSVESECCIIYYISGTDAEKDLEALKSMADADAADVESRFGTQFNKKIPLTFLPRTLGHGGFTTDGIYVSYLHENYAGSTTAQVTHHEMVHWLDGQIGGKFRPSIFQEGLAVFLSSGHFKVEPILQRAAALPSLGWYVPLRQLADAFYKSQHEAGYAEAAALINYLVVTYGWDQFNSFYRNMEAVPGAPDSISIDTALQSRFSISIDQLETNFKRFLAAQPYDSSDSTDMRLTVEFYNTVRKYQQELDNSAYFLNAWLPDVSVMRRRDIVADFLRHPDTLLNRQIEYLLVNGDANLRVKNYSVTQTDIAAVNILLGFDNLGN